MTAQPNSPADDRDKAEQDPEACSARIASYADPAGVSSDGYICSPLGSRCEPGPLCPGRLKAHEEISELIEFLTGSDGAEGSSAPNPNLPKRTPRNYLPQGSVFDLLAPFREGPDTLPNSHDKRKGP